jgi:uncharacterized protein (UPF0303 family)
LLYKKEILNTAYRENQLFVQRNIKVKVKVKQSHYRPGVAQRVPGS